MWFFRRKRLHEMHRKKEQELTNIKADTAKRVQRARKPMERLVNRLEQNGITLQIKAGMGSRHV